MNATFSLNDLETFVRAVEGGSFAAAARELGVPKSTVTRRVARLEDDLDLGLLLRETRRLTLTAAGAELHARCRDPLRAIREVHDSLRAALPVGVLRITAPHDLGTSGWFVRLTAAFRLRFPEVELDIVLTSRLVDLVEEGFDIALRATAALRDSDALMVRRLVSTAEGGLYASPDYVTRRGRPRSPRSLAKHDCLALPSFADRWQLRRGTTVVDVEPNVVVRSTDFAYLRAAVVAGMGVAVLPRMFAEPGVESGDLVRVLPRWSLPGGGLSLVWPRSRYYAPRLRAFLDFVQPPDLSELAA